MSELRSTIRLNVRGVASYVRQLFIAEAVSDDQPDRKTYGCSLVFIAEDREAFVKDDGDFMDLVPQDLRDAAEEVALAKWGKKKVAELKKKNKLKYNLRDGIERDGSEPFGEGSAFVNLSSSKRPVVVDRRRRRIEEPDGELYSGCYVEANVTVKAYEHKQGGCGIGFYVNGVQKVSGGNQLSAKEIDPDEVFQDLGDDPEDDADDMI